MNWANAHRIAMLAAAKAHNLYGIDTSRKIDIFEVIEKAGIVLVFRPMPRLSGAYIIDEKGHPGIILNASHPVGRQRYSGAHEFGHFFLKHKASVDLDRFTDQNPLPHVADTEKLAEAFAEWFLLPRKLIESALDHLGMRLPVSSADLYTASLRVGASFEALARRLWTLKMVPWTQTDTWLRAGVRVAKREIAGEPMPTGRQDVWEVRKPDDGDTLAVRPGDRIVIHLPEIPTSGHLWRWTGLDSELSVIADDYRKGVNASNYPELAVAGSVLERRFVIDVPISEYASRRVIELRNGQAWEPNNFSDALRITLRVDPPRLGVSTSYFLAGT
jgi:Zn-dependent peptidase ImmA (M78 family)